MCELQLFDRVSQYSLTTCNACCSLQYSDNRGFIRNHYCDQGNILEYDINYLTTIAYSRHCVLGPVDIQCKQHSLIINDLKSCHVKIRHRNMSQRLAHLLQRELRRQQDLAGESCVGGRCARRHWRQREPSWLIGI